MIRDPKLQRMFGCFVCGCGPDYMDDDCQGCDRCGHGVGLDGEDEDLAATAQRLGALILIAACLYLLFKIAGVAR